MEHMNEHDVIKCSLCGKPIVNKYDLILHHTIELNDVNVNDPSISLNPDLIEPLHFKCHNKEHKRFGSNNYMKHKAVYVLYGAPCSGKSSWLMDNADDVDLIVDIDNIYQMISINPRFRKPNRLNSISFGIRNYLYDQIKYRSGKWGNAFVVTTGARSGERERLCKRVNADDLIFIDADKETCLQRATESRPAEWIQYINKWFNEYDEGRPFYEFLDN